MPHIRRSMPEPRLELLPLLDVVFLLLTFFIFALVLTARLEVTDIRLPLVAKGGEAKPGPVILLGLKADGTITLDGQDVDVADLLSKLRAAQEDKPGAALYIAPDREARNAQLFALMDALAEGGIRDLRFLREPRGDGSPGIPSQ